MFGSLTTRLLTRDTLLIGASLALVALATDCTDATPADPTSVVNTSQPRPEPLPPAGEEHIFIANADGSAPRRLAAGSWPAWSPDGERLSYERGGSIYVIYAVGVNETRLATGRSASWSPDGKKIAFVNEAGINTMNPDGTGVTLLLRHDFRDDTYPPWDMGPDKPVWSPDGKRIAFEHLGDGDVQPGQVYVMNADGSKLHGVTISSNGSTYAESDPAWSADGTKLVYWSYWPGLVVTDANGGIARGIYAAAYGSNPSWSPDGGSIVFNVNRYSPTLSKEIRVVSLQGTEAKVLLLNAFDLAFSPDGTHIAFVSTR